MSNGEDVASSLIDALADEGEHVDDGAFTLDPGKARQKLREYQLVDPLGYVLLLVEAAHIASTQPSIDVQVGPTTSASFQGVTLPDEQLRNLFSAVFRHSEQLVGEELVRVRVLQLLAIAANAALAAGAKRVELTNTDSDRRVRSLTIGADDETRLELLESEDASEPGHTVFRFVRSALDFSDAGSERALLKRHCELASMPILVDGTRMDAGQQAAFAGFREVETTAIGVDEHGIVGVGARVGSSPARAMILTRSVLAEVIDLEECKPGFVAVVDVDLRKDLSQRQVLRDAEFEAVLAAIVRAEARLPWSTGSVIERKKSLREVLDRYGPPLVIIVAVSWLIFIFSLLL
jgi:hypothetical protein